MYPRVIVLGSTSAAHMLLCFAHGNVSPDEYLLYLSFTSDYRIRLLYHVPCLLEVAVKYPRSYCFVPPPMYAYN
jgi:hypothetical protein